MDDPISTKEAGAILGCHARTVRRRIDAGALPAERDEDNNYWIERRDAERLAEAEAAARLATDSGGTDWKLEVAKYDAKIKKKRDAILGIELSELEGRMYREEFVEDALNQLVFAERAAYAALPGKLAPLLAAETDESVVAAAIKREIAAIQDDLARYGYDPRFFKERLAEARGKEAGDDDT